MIIFDMALSFQYLFVGLMGVIFGSFIAAYSYRFPRGIKITEGFSFCDNCERKINWYENIPVVSFIYLGGKCFTCKKKISVRYPLIELATAIAFLVLSNYFGLTVNLFVALILYLILSLIFIIDFEHQLIPDDFVFFGILVVFGFLFLTNSSIIFSSVAAGLISSVFLLLIYLVTAGRGMGLGDVKFAFLGGMLVGINLLFVWMLSAFLTGAVVGSILILSKSAKLKDKIAFGPFLIIGIPISFLWGQKLLEIMGIGIH